VGDDHTIPSASVSTPKPAEGDGAENGVMVIHGTDACLLFAPSSVDLDRSVS
jgi:hypothetical protein